MATLGEMRLRVFQLIDDTKGNATTDGTRWLLTEVDAALGVAVDIVASTYASLGGAKLDELATLTLTSGLGDLSSLKPLMVKSVVINVGGTYYPISQVSQNEAFQNNSTYTSLVVRLVRTATFPSAQADTVTYGGTSGIKLLDELIISLASRMLLRKDREQIAGLEVQQKELLSALISIENSSVASDYPGRSIALPVNYTLVGNSVQLVNKVGQSINGGNFFYGGY